MKIKCVYKELKGGGVPAVFQCPKCGHVTTKPGPPSDREPCPASEEQP